MPKDDFRSPLSPLEEPPPKKPPTPAPAWVALSAAWVGLASLIAAIVLPFLPGSRDPRAELEHLHNFSLADRFLPVPIYGSAIAMFLGIIVLWQMRRELRPLPQQLVAQRVQARVGIALGLAAAAIIYIWVALRGPIQ